MSNPNSKFIMPEGVVKDEATATPTYARFTAEPFEGGYAQTVGNSLRRVLLSSIEGVAITAIKLEGASHEFMTVEGISEDVTDIVIALKQVLIKVSGSIPERISIHRKGPCVITAGDFQKENAVEIINPDLKIATVADGVAFNLEAEIALGHGFHPAEWNKRQDQEIGIIPIDSIFSPVSRVNFQIEPKRVGNRTDYEKLVLDVWTDGRITPDAALAAAVDRIAAVRHGARRVVLVHHHRHDDARRGEVDDPLDLGVVAGRHAVEARHARAVRGHQVLHGVLAAELAVLAVEPHEVETRRAGELGHGAVRERDRDAERRLARPYFAQEGLKTVAFHVCISSLLDLRNAAIVCPNRR